jgi:hypothetical protein
MVRASTRSPSFRTMIQRCEGSSRRMIQPEISVSDISSRWARKFTGASSVPATSPRRSDPSTGRIEGTGTVSTAGSAAPLRAAFHPAGAASPSISAWAVITPVKPSMAIGEPGTGAPVSAQRRCRTWRPSGSSPPAKAISKPCRPSPIPDRTRPGRLSPAITVNSGASSSTSSRRMHSFGAFGSHAQPRMAVAFASSI